MAVQKLDKLDKQILRMISEDARSAYSETNEYGSAERFAICY